MLAPAEAKGLSEGLRLYGWMVLSRELDEVLCAANPRWFPSAGEEAAMVGAFCDLRPDDAIAAHYRDPLVIYMMRGAEMARLVAQVLGKVGGYNKGRSVPFTGPVDLNIVPWVAGDLGTSLGVATGAALAFQQEGSDRVCVCSFGDGTANVPMSANAVLRSISIESSRNGSSAVKARAQRRESDGRPS